LLDIGVIVHGDESVAPHTPIGNGGNNRQDDADGGNLPRLMGCASKVNSLPGRRLWRALTLGFVLLRSSGHDGQPAIILTRRFPFCLFDNCDDLGVIPIVGDRTIEQTVQLLKLPSPVKRVSINYYYDVLAIEN
jgi:hypothetical protein